MSFPVNPKHGLVHKQNGYTYVYDSTTNCWDKLNDTELTPVVGQPRKTRKTPKALKQAPPTIDINVQGVSDVLS